MSKVDERAAQLVDALEPFLGTFFTKAEVETMAGLELGQGIMRRVWRRAGLLADARGLCLTTANPWDDCKVCLTGDPDVAVNSFDFMSRIRTGVQKVERRHGNFIRSGSPAPGTDAALVKVVLDTADELSATIERLGDELTRELSERRRRSQGNGAPTSNGA